MLFATAIGLTLALNIVLSPKETHFTARWSRELYLHLLHGLNSHDISRKGVIDEFGVPLLSFHQALLALASVPRRSHAQAAAATPGTMAIKKAL